MARVKAKSHVHKYRLVPMNTETKVWACGKSECNHYMPPNMQYMVEGKSSECWDCFNVTTMSTDRMQYAILNNEGRMLCDDCITARTENKPRRYNEVPSMGDIVAKTSSPDIDPAEILGEKSAKMTNRKLAALFEEMVKGNK